MEIQLQPTNHKQINEMITKFEQDHLIHFRQAHRMIDLFETIIKTNTAILLANYFDVNKISDEVAKKLVQGMRTPSLGTWLGFNEVVFEQLAYNNVSENVFETIYHSVQQHDREKMDQIYKKEKNTYVFRPKEEQGRIKRKGQFFERLFSNYYRNHNANGTPFTNLVLPSFYTDYRTWHNMASNEVVKFRNEYAHGATPTEEECLQDIQNNLDNLNESLSLPWLHDTSVIVFSEDLQSLEIGAEWVDITMLQLDKTPEPHIPYLVLPDNSLLRLFPIVTYQPITGENKQSISFFNDLKGVQKNEISYLNYPYAEHIRDDEIYAQFIEVFRLEEWRKNLLNEFEDLMLRLQESFKGRTDELAYLQTFVERNNRGFLYLYGIPGIGKSALVANAFQEPNEKRKVIKYFVRNRRYTHVTEVLDYLNRTIDQMYRQQIQLSLGLGDTEEEKRKLLHERLQHVTPHLVSNDEKLIIIIDGLDEGDQALLNNLIFETYANVLVIYVARQTPEVTGFINDLPLDYLTKKEIGKISSEDIRAMLYEVVNKYNITESYVQAIAEKSDGHPLYVRLLCDSLVEYPEKLNDEHYLPEKWEEFYKRFIDRFIDDEHGQIVLEGLFVFAAAKDYLSKDQMRLILRNNAQQNLIIFNRLSELLIESLEQRQHYQLFHETFHEYIMNHYAFDVMDAEEKLLKYCLRWNELERYGESILLYPLNHLSTHLQDKNDLSGLETLVHHENFIDKQLRATGGFTASFVLLEAYRSEASKQGNEVALIDAMVQIVKLNERLRSGRISLNNNSSWTLAQWKSHLQNLCYYNEQEKGRILLVNLFTYIKQNGPLLVEVVNEIDQFLPHDTQVFNWSVYVPLPLLIEVSIQLQEKQVDSSFIASRVFVNKQEIISFLKDYQFDEVAVPVIKLFIDYLYKSYPSTWITIMIQFIERIIVLDLSKCLSTYQATLLQTVSEFSDKNVSDKALSLLASFLVNTNQIEDGFKYIAKITNDWDRQLAYQKLYDQSKEKNTKVAELAYTQGIQITDNYTDENRPHALIKWLTAIVSEKDMARYRVYKSEIKQAMDEDLFLFQFGALEDLATYYWNNRRYELAINVVKNIMPEESRDKLLYEYYILSEVESHCPKSVKDSLKSECSLIDERLFKKDDFELEKYSGAISVILTHWVQLGKIDQIKQFLQPLQSEIVYSDIYMPLVSAFFKQDQIKQMMKVAIEIPKKLTQLRVYTKSVNFMIKHDLESELLQLIQALERKEEQIVSYAAIQALKANKLHLFQHLQRKVMNEQKLELLTYNEIYVVSAARHLSKAMDLLKTLLTNVTMSEYKVHRIHEAKLQRVIHLGRLEQVHTTNVQDFSYLDQVEKAINYYLLRNELEEAYMHYERNFNKTLGINDFVMFKYDRISMLQNIVIKMSEQGDVRVIERLDNSVFRAPIHIYVKVAEIFNKQGLIEEASNVINRCEEIITENPLQETSLKVNFYSVANIYFTLANYYGEYNNETRAKSLLEQITDELSQNHNIKASEDDLARVYFRLAYEFRKLHLTEQYQDYKERYKKYLDNRIQSVIWSDYVELLIRDHRFDEALHYLERASMRSLHYEKMIYQLKYFDQFERLIEIYKRLQTEKFLNESGNPLEGRKMILRYLFEENKELKAYKLIQSEQNIEERFQLYKEVLPSITPERLALFLEHIIKEQDSIKRRLEKELLIYAITDPDYSKEQLQQIMSTLSVEKETTALALYVYRTFKKRRFDDSIDDTLVQTIDEVLHVE